MDNTTGNNDSQWQLLFEMQNQQMQALIQALKSPGENNSVTLPEFNPDNRDADARAWCATADLCFDQRAVKGSQLIITISKALKGSASTWLSQISYPGMTWLEFKELFTARFVHDETLAATLITLNNDKPNENETHAAYASRLITTLLNRWKDLSVENIAVSTVMAHLAQIDSRLQRLAFTTEVTTRHQLQRELQAFSHLKRKAPLDMHTDLVQSEKRPKFIPLTQIKCHACGKLGHKKSDCRKDKSEAKTPSTTGSNQRQQSNGGPLVCFKCGTPGHVASRCSAGSSATTSKPVERRVDLCAVESPSGTHTF